MTHLLIFEETHRNLMSVQLIYECKKETRSRTKSRQSFNPTSKPVTYDTHTHTHAYRCSNASHTHYSLEDQCSTSAVSINDPDSFDRLVISSMKLHFCQNTWSLHRKVMSSVICGHVHTLRAQTESLLHWVFLQSV